ncbi:hypothetical protein C5S32_10205 [ANME-1 cluster archaeon GoMg1]|nr:hypothetical protein [ANME-1 cluster archaeon GoMg1]
MPLAILYREELKEYDFGAGHPFRGARYEKFYRFLKENLSDEFYLFHSADNRPIGRPGKLEEAARLIVGQAKRAVDLVEGGEFEKASSIGGGMHHAKSGFGEGFCIFVYQIGEGEGKGDTINVPMPIGASYDSYKSVFVEIIEPVVKEFEPELIVRYGGSDPYLNDQLTQLGLPIKGFRMIGEKTREIAEICQGKEIDLIASGYNEDVLPYAWLALISGLAGLKIAVKEREPIAERYRRDLASKDTEKVVREVKEELKDYWRCFG